MALGIIQHPLKAKFVDSNRDDDTFKHEELLSILEDEDPFIMSLCRLELLVNGSLHYGSTAALRGYLAGILDCRRMYQAVLS